MTCLNVLADRVPWSFPEPAGSNFNQESDDGKKTEFLTLSSYEIH